MLRQTAPSKDWETLMTLPDAESILRATEAEIGRLMPVALDMIASVVAKPGTSLEDYDALTTVAEAESSLLLLAIVRAAAGMAAIAEMSAVDVRSLGKVPIAALTAAD